MGTPVAAIGVEWFVKMTGQAMVRTHGYADFPWVIVPGSGSMQNTNEDIKKHVDIAMPQIEKVLSQKVQARPAIGYTAVKM